MDWNPEEVKQAVDLELHGTIGENAPTHRGVASERIVESAPYAAETIARIALYSESEANRLKASMYIMDRVFGKITDVGFKADGEKQDAIQMFTDVIVPEGENINAEVTSGSDDE